MRSRLLITALALSLCAPLQGYAATVDGMIAWPWKPRAVVEVRGPIEAAPMVDLFNEAIPEYGPTLVFVEAPVKDCTFREPPKGGIDICWLPDEHFAYGQAFFNINSRGSMIGAAVGIQRGGVDDPTLYCHEMMHALTGLGDRSGTQPGKSCLYGHGDAPGVWDRGFFAKLYASDKAPHKKHRRKHHR